MVDDGSTRWQDSSEGGGSGDTPAPQDEPAMQKLARWMRAPNIATELSESELGRIGMLVKRETEIDEQSRSDWRDRTEKAISLARQHSEPKNYPWPKASNVIYPLMTTATLQFAARAYPAVIANKAVVKGVILGRDDGVPQVDPQTGQPAVNPQSGAPVWAQPPGVLQARADRIGAHMSWQLLDEMPEWEPETDKLLHQMPVQGSYFRKSYFDPAAGRNMSLVVPPLKLILNYWAKSLELAPRATEELQFYPYEIREFERAGLWLERRFTPEPGADQDDDAPIVFYEQHRWLDLDGDNYPEPYIVTIDKEGAQVVRIVARFDETGVHLSQGPDGGPQVARIDPLQFYTQYDFLPSLDGGIYGTGFGQLLGPINAAVNTTLNMLIDAGHLANTNGGFIAKNLSVQAGALRFTMGEFKPVNAGGMSLRDSILPLPFAGPNQALYALLGTLIEAGKDVASVKDVLAGEQPQANVPATTVLALIEQGQKVFTAIFKRIHRSLKSELQKLYRLNRLYLPEMVEFRINEQWLKVTREDYEKGAGVEPISDPTMVSDMQQLGRAQYLMQFRNDPLIQQGELTRRLLKAAAIDDLDKLMVQNPQPPPGLLMKQAELANDAKVANAKEMVAKAQSLMFLTQGALNLANADKLAGDQHLAWIEQNMRGLELEFDMWMQQQTGGQDENGQPSPVGTGGPSGGPSGPQPAGLPALAPPPGQQGGPQVPGGPAGGAMGGIASAIQRRIAGSTNGA